MQLPVRIIEVGIGYSVLIVISATVGEPKELNRCTFGMSSFRKQAMIHVKSRSHLSVGNFSCSPQRQEQQICCAGFHYCSHFTLTPNRFYFNESDHHRYKRD